MKLEYLYAFIAVYNEKSLTKAALSMNLSDKTVQKYLNNLEEEVGVKLTIRTRRGIEFTEEGVSFYLYSNNTIATLDSFKNNINKKNKDYIIASEIRIFFTGIIRCAEKIIDKYKVKFSFKELYREEVLKGVFDKKYDLGIITMDKGLVEILESYNLEFIEVAKRNTVAIVNINHPLANKDEISLTELRDYKRLVFENPFDDYYNYYYDIEKKYSLPPSNIYLKYLGDVKLILKNTSSYYLGGITDYEANNLSELKAIKIIEMEEKIKVGYVLSKERPNDNVIKELIEIVSKNIGNFSTSGL